MFQWFSELKLFTPILWSDTAFNSFSSQKSEVTLDLFLFFFLFVNQLSSYQKTYFEYDYFFLPIVTAILYYSYVVILIMGSLQQYPVCT